MLLLFLLGFVEEILWVHLCNVDLGILTKPACESL